MQYAMKGKFKKGRHFVLASNAAGSTKNARKPETSQCRDTICNCCDAERRLGAINRLKGCPDCNVTEKKSRKSPTTIQYRNNLHLHFQGCSLSKLRISWEGFPVWRNSLAAAIRRYRATEAVNKHLYLTSEPPVVCVFNILSSLVQRISHEICKRSSYLRLVRSASCYLAKNYSSTTSREQHLCLHNTIGIYS
jgi:hypothetical protein